MYDTVFADMFLFNLKTEKKIMFITNYKSVSHSPVHLKIVVDVKSSLIIQLGHMHRNLSLDMAH